MLPTSLRSVWALDLNLRPPLDIRTRNQADGPEYQRTKGLRTIGVGDTGFAITATVLVLELRPPEVGNGRREKSNAASAGHDRCGLDPYECGVLQNVGMTGFEPAALRPQNGCATKLRYIPVQP